MEKKILFRAQDGFDIYEDDVIHEVNKPNYTSRPWTMTNFVINYLSHKNENRIFFKMNKNAENYIRLNKPKFSETDLRLALRQHNIADHFVEHIIQFANQQKDGKTDF